MRVKSCVLLVVFAAACAVVVPSAVAANPTQINYELTANATIPTADPCVVTPMQADIVDFLPALRPTQVRLFAGSYNICTGEEYHAIAPFDFYTFTDEKGDGFSVNEGGRSADLNLTFEAYDFTLGEPTIVNTSLHWEKTSSNPSDAAARVTGTITSDNGLSVTLDDSIPWNTPGGPSASIVHCMFTQRGVFGCIGQG